MANRQDKFSATNAAVDNFRDIREITCIKTRLALGSSCMASRAIVSARWRLRFELPARFGAGVFFAFTTVLLGSIWKPYAASELLPYSLGLIVYRKHLWMRGLPRSMRVEFARCLHPKRQHRLDLFVAAARNHATRPAIQTHVGEPEAYPISRKCCLTHVVQHPAAPRRLRTADAHNFHEAPLVES